tara:strand:+ start:12720 stop:13391 length:672 start_codon:yes stop_codon:yes gene_type:complete
MTRIPSHKIGIMVHALATMPHWAFHSDAARAVVEVRNWHINERGWRDIAYAGIIDATGAWANGRDLDSDGDVWEETGAGARGFNRQWIHLALTGGHGGDANDLPSDHYTPEQMAALREKIDHIQALAGRDMQVIGHNEVANKACPCFQVQPWYAKKPARTITSSSTIQGAVTTAVGAVGTGGAAISQLDGRAQIVVLVLAAVMAVGLFVVFKSRIRDWANGRK